MLYFKNNFNLIGDGYSVISEELSGKITQVPRSLDYVGYNIVYDSIKLEQVYFFGHVFDIITVKCVCAKGFEEEGKCVTNNTEILCETYSNIFKLCLQWKDNNQYLNKWVDEFGQECYNYCPPTLYGDL